MEAVLQLRLLPMCVKLTTKVGMAVSNSIRVTIETKKEKKERWGGGRDKERQNKERIENVGFIKVRTLSVNK